MVWSVTVTVATMASTSVEFSVAPACSRPPLATDHGCCIQNPKSDPKVGSIWAAGSNRRLQQPDDGQTSI